MSRATISARIKVNLGTAGCSNIYERKRWTNNEDKFRSIFKKTVNGVTHIEGWFIQRVNTQEQFLTNRENLFVHTWHIQGIYGIDDDADSETTFQDLIETICTTFRGDWHLNSTCENINPNWGPGSGRGGIQVDLVDERMFCRKILCHHCDLSLYTQERVDRSRIA